MSLNKSQIKELCKELLDDFERVLSWKWDSGFDALVAEFPTDKQADVRSVLERHLGFKWDSHSIRKAPAKIKAKTGDLGDLRDNQLLFTTDPEGDILIFAAWWPWGNGEVVSVRIASPSIAEQAPETQGILSKIKRLFGPDFSSFLPHSYGYEATNEPKSDLKPPNFHFGLLSPTVLIKIFLLFYQPVES